jgi:tetratricopeptide (TPR) repeat protein
VAAALVALAALATALHADRARGGADPRPTAEAALQASLERGNEAPEVRSALVELRRGIERRPLDARSRVAYAGLVLGMSTEDGHRQLAAFHARRAVELAPVTVPIVRAAALVAAQAGEAERSVEWIRRMFGYDPASAADLLALIEATALGLPVEAALPDSVEAWLAWARKLRRDGRLEQAQRWIERAQLRWPDDLQALAERGALLAQRQDWTALAELLPPRWEPPDSPVAAMPLLQRARLALSQGDPEGARADLERALRLHPGAWDVALQAGQLFDGLGDPARARTLWHGALHGLDPSERDARRAILIQLARLEDRDGRAGTALRLWRSVLELDPRHAEAGRRIHELSGG